MQAIVEFQSANPAAIVYVELGFLPDDVEIWSDYTGTPKVLKWINNTKFPNFPVANAVLLEGGTTAFTANAGTLVAPYAGGDVVAANETVDTAGKHVNRKGTPALAGRITSPGIAIAAGIQVNSGRMVVIANRNDQ